MDGATIQEFTQLRAEFTKELSRLKEQVRAMHARDFQFRAEVEHELLLLKRDVEDLQDSYEARQFGGEYIEASQKIDQMLARVH